MPIFRGHVVMIEVPVEVTVTGNRTFAFRQRQPNTRDYARYIYLKVHRETGLGPKPDLWIDWVEWEGPFVDTDVKPPHKRIFFKDWKTKEDDQYAREIIVRFANRAFRIKEPTKTFVDKLMGLYREQRKSGAGFRVAIKETLAVVLASPSFLYLIEPVPGEQKRRLNDLELAVRLSYFLWSGPPDEELLQVARAGKLNDPSILWQQSNRLLNDPRSAEFIRGFTHQWLHMDRLDFFQFNFRKYPEFDESIKEATRNEVYETIQFMLKTTARLATC